MRDKQHKKHLSIQQKKRIASSQASCSGFKARVIAHRKRSIILFDGNSYISATRRANLPEIVVGDRVMCDKSTNGRIVARLPRINSFMTITRGVVRSFAANIDGIIFVCAPIPSLDPSLLDNALLNAAANNIDAIIVCNKTDLLAQVDSSLLQDTLSMHADNGRKVCYVSVINSDYSEVSASLQNGATYLLFGQSGVGKSSLLNCLSGKESEMTQSLSNHTSLGMHTTSVARLHIVNNFFIIDCPGVRSLTVPKFTEEGVFALYGKIKDLASCCQFRNCSHGKHELSCAVQAEFSKNPTEELRRAMLLLDIAKTHN